MTAATLTTQATNVQKLTRPVWVEELEQKRAAAEAAINESVAEAKAAAVEARDQAQAYTKRQVEFASFQLALMVPVVLVLLACLVGAHANFEVIGHLLPGCGYAVLGYVLYSVLGNRRFRSEP